MKTEIHDKWKNSIKKLAYPCEYFNSLDDYQKPVDNITKEGSFSKLKTDYRSDKEKERTKEINKLFIIKNGEELTQPF